MNFEPLAVLLPSLVAFFFWFALIVFVAVFIG